LEGYTLSVDLTIQPGWHINANPASDPSLIPTEIIEPPGQITIVDVAYPTPESLTADFANESIAVYSGSVRLAAEITHSGNLDGNETFVLRYQACDESRCLLPSEIELKPVIVLPQ
jgi:DsbC/DsbD-like thiol-disulfide interchange protein